MAFELYRPKTAGTRLSAGTMTIGRTGLCQFNLGDLMAIGCSDRAAVLIDIDGPKIALVAPVGGQYCLSVTKTGRPTARIPLARVFACLGLSPSVVAGRREIKIVKDKLVIDFAARESPR